MKRAFLIVSILLLNLVVGFAQTVHPDSARYAYDYRYFRKAIWMHHYLIKHGRLSRWEKGRAYARIAICYEQMNMPDSAIRYYKKAMKKHPDIKYWEEVVAQYKKAKRYHQAVRILKWHPRRLEEAFRMQELQVCKMAKSVMKKSSEYKVIEITELNTPYGEYAPGCLDAACTRIVFTSTRNFTDKYDGYYANSNFFLSHLGDNGHYLPPVQMDTAANRLNNAGVISLDAQRSIIFFTVCGTKAPNTCKLYYAFLKGDMAAEGYALPLPASFSTAVSGHPAFSDSLQVLVFASDANGSNFGKDLWMMKYNRLEDTWSEPESLGPEINTSGNEMFPFVAADGTLYFSSDGHGGLGGLDLYKATFDGTKWGKPVALPYPVNSSSDDFGINVLPDGHSGFFSSERKGHPTMDDLFYFYDTLRSFNHRTALPDTSLRDEDLHKFYNTLKLVVIDESGMDIRLYEDSTGALKIGFKTADSMKVNIRICTSKGRIIYHALVQTTREELVRSIPVSLPPGINYIQVLVDGRIMGSRRLKI